MQARVWLVLVDVFGIAVRVDEKLGLTWAR
jgi:hypothetical protein